MAHRFRHDMQAGGGVKPEFSHRIAFEDLQNLAERGAAGTGGRGRQDVIAAIAAMHRLALDGAIAAEILETEDAALGPARCHDRRGNRALVEGIGSPVGDPSQRRRQLRLPQPIARGQRIPILEEDPGRVGLGREVLAACGQNVRIRAG